MVNNKINFFNIPHDALNIDINNILNFLGYKKSDKADRATTKKIDYYIKKCTDICNPRGCYLIKEQVNIDTKKEYVEINKTILEVGKKIISQLNHTESLALFICTAGEEIENLSKKLIKNSEYLEGYIVDTIGSEIAESAADFIHKKIISSSELIKFKATNRYSPGYCNWNVIEQFKLFSFFTENSCDISLNESGLMKPIKSVSGIVGVGKNVKFGKHSCKLCNYKSCQSRLNKAHF